MSYTGTDCKEAGRLWRAPESPHSKDPYTGEGSDYKGSWAVLENRFAGFYCRYLPVVRRFILYQRLRDPSAVDDLCQEVFTRIWENRRHLHLIKSVDDYLYTLVLNRVCDLRRRAEKRREVHRAYEQTLHRCHRCLLRQLEYRQALLVLHRALDSLPLCRQRVGKLYFIGGLSVQQISGLLGLSGGTVKNTTSRARQQLTPCLNRLRKELSGP